MCTIGSLSVNVREIARQKCVSVCMSMTRLIQLNINFDRIPSSLASVRTRPIDQSQPLTVAQKSIPCLSVDFHQRNDAFQYTPVQQHHVLSDLVTTHGLVIVHTKCTRVGSEGMFHVRRERSPIGRTEIHTLDLMFQKFVIGMRKKRIVEGIGFIAVILWRVWYITKCVMTWKYSVRHDDDVINKQTNNYSSITWIFIHEFTIHSLVYYYALVFK